ncbi:cupin domain-containing protein [Amycolatopsis jejuensis]|uniref:cupin domain-containing protein n=1 Tax=Amycolatopsis jejuensis TaxID=330084 RepID=UPI000A4D3C6B|nr:AraC family transcriptional regulator [Amycolatopsis jejuensis]
MQALLEVVPEPPTSSWACYVRSQPSFAFEWHYHEELELVLIEEGSGQRYVGSSVERYAPGDLVLVGSDVPHTWRSDSPGPHRAIVCQFKREFLGTSFFETVEFAQVKAMLDRSAGGLRFCAQENADVAELVAALPGHPPVRRTLDLLTALSLLAPRPATRLSTVVDHRRHEKSRHRIHDAIDIIHCRYGDSLSLDDVAAETAMTPGALSRSFRRTTGQSFTAYVNFNRRFRERFAASPREYRAAFTRGATAHTTP